MTDPYDSPGWRTKFRQDCNQIAAEAQQEHRELIHLRAENERLRRCLGVFANPSNWIAQLGDHYRDPAMMVWDGSGIPEKLAADALRDPTDQENRGT